MGSKEKICIIENMRKHQFVVDIKGMERDILGKQIRCLMKRCLISFC